MGDYAVDGQKIAKKLSVGITKETKRYKTLLEEYNLAGHELQSTDPQASLSDILVPNSDFWNSHAFIKTESSNQISWKEKEEIIQAFLIIQRSEEELLLLKEDMHATVRYWFTRIKHIEEKLSELSPTTGELYIKGARCLLQHLLWEATLQYSRATGKL